MFKIPLATWIANAAARLAETHGDVTHQAEAADCSRQTVSDHARKVQAAVGFLVPRSASSRGATPVSFQANPALVVLTIRKGVHPSVHITASGDPFRAGPRSGRPCLLRLS